MKNATLNSTTLNVGGLFAEASAHIEYNLDTADGKELQAYYAQASKEYDVCNAAHADALSLVKTAQDVLSHIATLREIALPWEKRVNQNDTTPSGKGQPVVDLPKHASGLPNACIFSSVDMNIVRNLTALDERQAKVKVLAQYMHDQPYYSPDGFDDHMYHHALRNALLIDYPTLSTSVLQFAHDVHAKRSYVDVLGAAKNDPDFFLILEAPANASQWAIFWSHVCTFSDYNYQSVLAVDPNKQALASNSNLIAVASRVLFEVDNALVPAVYNTCTSTNANADAFDWTLGKTSTANDVLYALRAKRAVTIVFPKHQKVYIATHLRNIGEAHGECVAAWTKALYYAAELKYKDHDIVISGDFNFMSHDAASTAQAKLVKHALSCGNTSAYGKLVQKPSMNRKRSKFQDQGTKAGIQCPYAKMTVVTSNKLTAPPAGTYLRTATCALVAAAIVHAASASRVAAFVAAAVTYALAAATQRKPAASVTLHGDPATGTPGPTTPLDHLPILVRMQPVAEPCSTLWQAIYWALSFLSIFALLV